MLKLKYSNKMDNKQNSSVPTAFGLLGIEHKIGEVFEDEGKNLQCVESFGCNGCYYNDLYSSYCKGECSVSRRKDRTSVIFKEIKK